MGVIDVEGKQYLSNNIIFADAFNFLLYDGEEVIKPDDLRELDTTELTVPYGNNARDPVQKYRDILKIWNAMMDDRAVYVILGAELQDKVHYGMPVKDGLYDMLGYSKQIAEKKRSYRKDSESQVGEGDLTIENDVMKIKLTSAEFLSGLRKGDKLKPIITAVVYLGEDPWDGPRSLFEMLNVQDERLYRFLNDYKLNLISPADIADEEFHKFHTDLGFAMKLIKHQSTDAVQLILQERNRKIDPDTAFFLNAAIKTNLELEVEEGGVDMCKSMENKEKKDRVTGAIEAFRLVGTPDEDIITKIVNHFGVTKEYVLALLKPQKA